MIVPLKISEQNTNYTIDELGNVYNIKTGKNLKGSIKNGYKSVKLTINKEKKDYLIHRLVALHFLENPMNLSQVNHKDGNKLNNSVDNLEWISASDNIKHSWNQAGRNKRQKIQPIEEEILNNPKWKQYLNTNYYFCKDGRGVNIKTGKYLNTSLTNDGYLKYSLYINQKSINVLAQIIIYKTFYPDEIILKNEQINHKDGNKLNNCIKNLEKISNSENMYHSYYILKQNTKKVSQYDKQYNLIATYESISEAARKTGFTIGGISQAMNGKIKSYKGFYWKQV